MTHHNKNLLMNLPVRHSVEKIETEDEELEQQITKFVDMKIVNFFILSR